MALEHIHQVMEQSDLFLASSSKMERQKIILELAKMGVNAQWCEQFQTKDLQEMLEKIQKNL